MLLLFLWSISPFIAHCNFTNLKKRYKKRSNTPNYSKKVTCYRAIQRNEFNTVNRTFNDLNQTNVNSTLINIGKGKYQRSNRKSWLKLTTFAIHSPFFLFRRDEKKENNNQSRDFYLCLSARSISNSDNNFTLLDWVKFFFFTCVLIW